MRYFEVRTNLLGRADHLSSLFWLSGSTKAGLDLETARLYTDGFQRRDGELLAYDAKVGPSHRQKGCAAEIGHAIEFGNLSSGKA